MTVFLGMTKVSLIVLVRWQGVSVPLSWERGISPSDCHIRDQSQVTEEKWPWINPAPTVFLFCPLRGTVPTPTLGPCCPL